MGQQFSTTWNRVCPNSPSPRKRRQTRHKKTKRRLTKPPAQQQPPQHPPQQDELLMKDLAITVTPSYHDNGVLEFEGFEGMENVNVQPEIDSRTWQSRIADNSLIIDLVLPGLYINNPTMSTSLLLRMDLIHGVRYIQVKFEKESITRDLLIEIRKFIEKFPSEFIVLYVELPLTSAIHPVAVSDICKQELQSLAYTDMAPNSLWTLQARTVRSRVILFVDQLVGTETQNTFKFLEPSNYTCLQDLAKSININFRDSDCPIRVAPFWTTREPSIRTAIRHLNPRSPNPLSRGQRRTNKSLTPQQSQSAKPVDPELLALAQSADVSSRGSSGTLYQVSMFPSPGIPSHFIKTVYMKNTFVVASNRGARTLQRRASTVSI